MNTSLQTRSWIAFGVAALVTALLLAAAFGMAGDAGAPAAQQPTSVRATLIPTIPLPDIPTATVSLDETLPPDALGQALPTSTVPDSQEPLPPVIFVREGNLWRGTGVPGTPQRLTDFGGDTTVMYPIVSPDGTTIAFIALIQPPIDESVPLPIARVYVMRNDGSDMRVVWEPENGLIQIPAWYPDGQKLYITWNGAQVAPGETEIERVTQVLLLDLQDGSVTTILEDAMDPAISRDGRLLAYLRMQADGFSMNLEVAELDGANPRVIVDGVAFPALYAPRFAPDGDRILFAAIGGPETDSQGYPIGAPGGHQDTDLLRALIEPPTAAAHGIPWDVWSIGVAGGGLRRLTSFYEDLPMVAFAPDGGQVAIMGYGGLYLMNPDGSGLRRIDSQGDHGGLDWPISATP